MFQYTTVCFSIQNIGFRRTKHNATNQMSEGVSSDENLTRHITLYHIISRHVVLCLFSTTFCINIIFMRKCT
jgi:hypothetical protein